MYLIYDKALIVRSSSSYLFYKKNDEGNWIEYTRLNDIRGNIYFIKGNKRI